MIRGLFDELEEGERLRDEGIAKVAARAEDWLRDAHRFAVQYDAEHGRVSVNEVRAWAKASGNLPPTPGAYSAVFKGSHWQDTGETVRAVHKEGHARKITVWTYRSTVYR